jgi:DNA-binding NarL/FixJ family response regulator
VIDEGRHATNLDAGMSAIRCVIGDDHETLRRGLVSLFDAEDDLSVIGEAGDGRTAMDLTAKRKPDVTVLDVRMPQMDGIEFCREAASRSLETPVVLYTAVEEVDTLQTALDAGAKGYVLKSSPPTDLLRAVRAVHSGQLFLDRLLERQAERANTLLSPREAEVLQLLANGLTTDEVAKTIFLSPATVRSYAEHAMHKLKAHNRVHAVAEALRRSLIE